MQMSDNIITIAAIDVLAICC